MMSTRTTLTMIALIDETLDYVSRYMESPALVVIGSNAITTTSDTLFNLSTGEASISDVLQFGQELLLVTGKSDDADPIYTAARGYLGTTKATYATNTEGGANPMYPRYQVQRAIERCFTRLNKHLPFIVSDTLLRESSTSPHVLLPAETVRVLEVGYVREADSRYTEIGGWLFVEDLPTATAVDGKLLRVPSWVAVDLDLIVKYQIPYVWGPDPATEASTIGVQVGSEELPVLFAAARLVGGREISRSELDKVEEWNHEAAIRGGVNLRLLRTLWDDFYGAVLEARSLQNVPKHRPYRKMARLP